MYKRQVVGPLGQATHIEKFGTVVCAGGGVGVAPMLPIVQALKAAGNRVITVLAGRNKDLIILEKEMRESSDEVIIMTDDGSYGRKGLVTEGVEEVKMCIRDRKQETPMATIMFLYSGTCKYDLRNNILLSFLDQALDMVYTAEIREKEGGTYGVSCNGSLGKYPKEELILQIIFQTDPAKKDVYKRQELPSL